MAEIRFADISEFQPSFNADSYLSSGHKVIIARAHNGNRPDNCWPGRRDYLRSKSFTAVGYYQYLVAGRDAGDQARDFIACVGSLRANEFAVVDSEEGSGNQTPRVEEWLSVVDPWQGSRASLYASQSWFSDRLSGTSHWGDRPLWMAAYSSTEPSQPHTWWQNTDHASFPGLPGYVDGNVYHDSADQFLAKVKPSKAAPAADDDECLCTVVKADGRLEVFTESSAGEIEHKWNLKEGGWSDWSSLGKP